MHDHVLNGLSKVFLKLDYHVVLFNTRGVGNSSGRSSLTGMSESQDLQAVLGYAVEEIANLDTVILVGYSYGALITSLIPSPIRLYPEKIKHAAHILVSYPLGPMVSLLTFFKAGNYTSALDKLLADPELNVFFIYGNKDQFFGSSRYDALVKRCQDIRRRAGTSLAGSLGPSAVGEGHHTQGNIDPLEPPKTPSIGKFNAEMIDHADHFWHGRSGRKLRQAVSDWVGQLRPAI